MATPARSRVPPELESHQSFPVFRVPGEHPRSPLERFLALFADVRAGETAVALLLTLDVFLLLTAYYLLKPLRESLLLSRHSAESKSYIAAAQAVILMIALPLYSRFAARVNRVRLVAGAALFFALNLILFSLAGSNGAKEGVPFYIWIGIFNIFSVSQFWAFANDLYTEAQGKRLFPIIGFGASLGGVVGAAAATLFLGRHWTPYQIMLLACVLVVATAALTVIVNARHRREPTPASAVAGRPLEPGGAFTLVLHDRYLLWIAVLMVLLNFVNSGGEYLVGRIVTGEAISRFGEAAAAAPLRERFIGSFSAGYLTTANLFGLVLQLFVTSRVIRYIGVRGGLFILPCVSLVCYSAITVVPVLAVVRFAKVFENGTEYSIQNTVRQALYLPTSREAKYKAKAFNDTFCMRAGDVASSGLVALMKSIGAGAGAFAFTNLLFVGGWLFVASRIFREHKRLTA